MKLKSLIEATSKYGTVDFYWSDDNLETPKDAAFHADDEFQAGPMISQIYKFGDGTKFYLYSKNSLTDPIVNQGIADPAFDTWYTRQAVIDRNGNRHDYTNTRTFHSGWSHYIDSITGAYDSKPFGPKEIAEFRQVFNL